ncbi:unnamed protein product [Psylliodes chrysocephalus]|uniref:Uncharacterized protein n=1 Tax=Psylliodes chrysocephalus TaxID=3402493 RepID=A0A9P0GM17_9CUCU|nr:unnamed protein product [Psylliodes chrysocephala]
MNIQAPSKWTTVLRNARVHPKPYYVVPISYRDILDGKSLAVPKKVKTSQGLEIKITDITRAKFDKSSINKFVVFTNYDLESEGHEVAFPEKRIELIPRAYNSELPINKKKLNNLLDLCKSLKIKKQYHAEYLALQSSNTEPDALPETDMEDNLE